MERKKNILVCPLDWGLGHATRMVPVIRELQNQGANVILAADNGPLEFLMRYFPNNTVIRLEGFKPEYPADGSMAWAMAKSLPKMITASKKAKKELQNIVDKYHIDALISDNRYELSNLSIPSVFVTHQLNIQTSGFQNIVSPILIIIVNYYLNKFDEVWVPDFENNQLSGKLSRSKTKRGNLYHVGYLTRFNAPKKTNSAKKIDLLVMLSGPEPQRSILEDIVTKQAIESGLTTVILQGKPDGKMTPSVNNVVFLPHASDDEITDLIVSTEYLICRPGYSTLMDLASIGKKAIFIPTPGQTEQEYLSRKLMSEGIAFSQSQSSFDLSAAILQQNNYTGLNNDLQNNVLAVRISNLLNNC